MTADQSAQVPQVDHHVELRWSVHLAREKPARLAISLAACALAAARGYAAFGWLGMIAVAAVMISALADFLFPVRYEITGAGASVRVLFRNTQIPWEKVKHVYLDNLGIKLSPLASASRLEAYRGVYLRFAGNRQQVIDAVTAMRDSHEH